LIAGYDPEPKKQLTDEEIEKKKNEPKAQVL